MTIHLPVVLIRGSFHCDDVLNVPVRLTARVRLSVRLIFNEIVFPPIFNQADLRHVVSRDWSHQTLSRC